MATKTKNPSIPEELRKALSDGTPLYAVAGVGDFAVEKLRTVPGLVLELRARVPELRARVPEPRVVAEDVQARVVALQSEARELPARATTVAIDLTAKAGDLYEGFAVRGKQLVDRISRQRATQQLREQAGTTVSATKRAATTARRSAKTTRSAAKGAATSARKTAETAVKAAEDAASKVG
jgi:hypothetical protein